MPTIGTFASLRTDIAGIPIADLARQYGTPAYVYDAAKIVERIDDLRSFDVIRYAQKSNSNLAILDLVRRQEVLVDAVSAGEIHRALKAGYLATGEPPPIVYTADIFDHDALQAVVAQNIHANLGSPDMIDQLGKLAPGRDITLRINPGFGHGHSQKTNTGGEQSKHGIWHGQIADCVRHAAAYDMSITGLHMHIGSGTDLEHLGQVCNALEQVAPVVGESLTTISAGGGLPIAYREKDSFIDLNRYFQLWDRTRCQLQEQFSHQITLEIEPGRYLSAESGFLVTEIRAVKQMGTNTFYLVDAGFNALARPILYGAYHPISIAADKADGSDRAMQDVVVGGPLCESGDIFTQAEGGYVSCRSLPQASVGDHLILECAGAYGMVMASNYNSKPLPAEVLIQEGQAHLIRARQSFDDLIRHETIPE